MNTGSPKKEKEMVVPTTQNEGGSESTHIVAPQNTLLNLAKLNIGTPRFEANSAANEENAEEMQNSAALVQENAGSGNVESHVQVEPVSQANDMEGGSKEMAEPEEERKGEILGDEKEEVVKNGAEKGEEKMVMLQVPEDELMRITGEEEPAKSEGGGEAEEINLLGEEEEKGEDMAEEVDMVNEDNRPELIEEERVEEEGGEEPRETIQTEDVVVEELKESSKIEEEAPVEKITEEVAPVVEEDVEIVQEQVEEEDRRIQQEEVEKVPTEPEVQPEEEEEVPAPVEDTPVEEVPAPVEETSAPVEETPAPVEETSAPVEETPVPVEETTVVEPEVQEPVEETVVEQEVVAVEEPRVEEAEDNKEEANMSEEEVEEAIQIKPESVESEKVEENLEMAQPPVMPAPPSNPQLDESSEEKEPEKEIQEESASVEKEEKIQEEAPEPEAANPILVRNQQISEDEKEMEFETQGSNRVFAWGSAECDQFECAQYESRRPVEINYFNTNKTKVSKIVCGSQHTLLLDSTGKVFSWGNSDDGVLGRDVSSKTPESRPGLVDLDSQVDMISAGDAHSVFGNSQTGELFFTGVIKSSNGKLSRVIEYPESITINKFKKSGIKSILSGANHVLIHSRFNVYAFGDNSCGALGYILRTYFEESDCIKPHALRLKGIARIFTGAYHCFAITNKGILKTWGLNSQGQLGLPYYIENGEDSDVNNEDPNRNPNVLQLPHQVGGIDGKKIVDIVGGEHHSLLLMDDGSVWGAGRNDDGQLGGLVQPPRESYEEVRIPNSRVKVAGTNSYVNVTNDYMPNTFMRLPIEKRFQEVQSRSHYNYAINREDNNWPKIYSWGSGFSYVLGNGNEDPLSTPFRISNQKLFKGVVPNQVALGFSHVVYFTGDSHEVVLDEPRVRNTRKRDHMTPVKRKEKYKGKRVKSK